MTLGRKLPVHTAYFPVGVGDDGRPQFKSDVYGHEERIALALEGKPCYFLYATIHSTEVSNGQAIIHIVHRLATESSPQIRNILDNSVVLLVPSQNPDVVLYRVASLQQAWQH